MIELTFLDGKVGSQKSFHMKMLARYGVIWIHDKAGIFSVKQFSSLLTQVDFDGCDFKFDRLWKLKVPPKVRSFIWMFILDRLPSKEFLKKRGVVIPDEAAGCPWCGLGVENNFHLFIACRFAACFWNSICSWWNLKWGIFSNIDDFINFCFNVPLPGNVKSWWLISISAALWKARNDVIFNNKLTSMADLVFFSKLRALYWLKVSPLASNLEDSVWWVDPSNATTCSSSSKEPNWISPPAGHVKFSVDGAFNAKMAGCGGILREESGNIRILFSGPLPPLGAEYAELMAIITALEIFLEANWKNQAKLSVESESMVILSWISDPLLRLWRWWKTFRVLDCLITKISNVQFQHVPKVKNLLADQLAKSGVQRDSLFKAWW